jgi:3-methyladenine DNA glycosylase/8-oxoguanine DNA glycosylase
MPRRRFPLPFPVDLHTSLQPLRVGKQDPSIRLSGSALLRASRTPDGIATLLVQHRGDHLDLEAWGPGAEWALERAPATVGAHDHRAGLVPHHPLVSHLHRAADGLRLPSTGLVFEALVPAILGQRVTGFEAKRSFRQLVERWGEAAPGPGDLLVLPEPQVLAALGYYELHVAGVERRRADALRRVAAHAARLEQLADAPGPVLRARLEAIPGVGPWTSAEVARVVVGDADAVSVGDFHLKHLIAHALAGEPRGTDDRMLELLEPFAGHRGRVCLLIECAGISAPRYGPRKRVQPLARR